VTERPRYPTRRSAPQPGYDDLPATALLPTDPPPRGITAGRPRRTTGVADSARRTTDRYAPR
jgi:hypothetical protein